MHVLRETGAAAAVAHRLAQHTIEGTLVTSGDLWCTLWHALLTSFD